jgi:hypothetical protein
LPSGAAAFHDELEKITRTMRNTAQICDVFQSPTESDKDGAKTRWNETPSAFLILLRRMPTNNQIEFLNGESVSLIPGRFSYPLALALHQNAVRVPRYLIKHAMAKQPSWLSHNMQDAVLAVLHEDATCEIIGTEDASPYHLEYRKDSGLRHTKNSNVSFTSVLDPSDDWF